VGGVGGVKWSKNGREDDEEDETDHEIDFCGTWCQERLGEAGVGVTVRSIGSVAISVGMGKGIYADLIM